LSILIQYIISSLFNLLSHQTESRRKKLPSVSNSSTRFCQILSDFFLSFNFYSIIAPLSVKNSEWMWRNHLFKSILQTPHLQNVLFELWVRNKQQLRVLDEPRISTDSRSITHHFMFFPTKDTLSHCSQTVHFVFHSIISVPVNRELMHSGFMIIIELSWVELTEISLCMKIEPGSNFSRRRGCSEWKSISRKSWSFWILLENI
jgi:hypothetical protein